MKTNLFQRLVVFLTITLLICSCSDQFKNKYAGKWIEAKREVDVISIDKNNEDYIITYEGKRLPAVYKDRNLEVTIGGLRPTMMLDEQTDRILFLEKEYVRFEKSISAQLCGVWYYGSEANSYIKITRNEFGRFKFQEGYKYEGIITWTESNGGTDEYDSDVYLKFVDGKLKGEYIYYMTHHIPVKTRVTLELNSNNKLIYTRDNEVNMATKTSD